MITSTTSVKTTTSPVSKHSSGQRTWQRVILLIMLGYEGLGCLAGGGLLVAAPDGRLMDMPVEIMHGFFQDFMIPGIILIGLGIVNIIAFFAVLRRTHAAWVMAGLAMGGLLIWFWIEIVVLGELHWLHAMWGIPVVIGALVTLPLFPKHNLALQKGLLVCGILSSLVYIAMNVFIPMLYAGYSSFSQAVSEIMAVDAPTRKMWAVWGCMYSALSIAFGFGIRSTAGENRKLRIIGILVIINAVIGIYWPPMHQREVLAAGEGTLSDTLHIAWTFITVPLFMIAIGIGATVFGKGFRWYSILTILIMLFFGVLTGMASPKMEANLPTPWMGVWERISIGANMIWVIVFATLLLRKANRASTIQGNS